MSGHRCAYGSSVVVVADACRSRACMTFTSAPDAMQRGEVVPEVVVAKTRKHPRDVARLPDGTVDLPWADLLTEYRLDHPCPGVRTVVGRPSPLDFHPRGPTARGSP